MWTTSPSLSRKELEMTETTDAGSYEGSRDLEFPALVERTRQKAFWMARDLLGDTTEAEDLTQEAYLRAYQRWDDFRGEAKRDTWFLRIVINLCLSHQRRRSIWRRISDWMYAMPHDNPLQITPKRSLDPQDLLEAKVSNQAIQEAMKNLPAGQRTAFVLRYLHELSIQEIAEITGNAPGTIKCHLFRALKSMKKHLSWMQEEPVSQGENP